MAFGVDFLIYMKTGEDEYTKIAGQRGGNFTRERETIDASSKDNYGWEDNEYGMASWSIEGDGVLVESDEAYLALEDAFHNRTDLYVRFQTAAGNKYEGRAIVTDLSIDAPHDDLATYSLTLQGRGAYEKIDGDDSGNGGVEG